MTITAQQVIDAARIALSDTAGTRWTNAEMLGYVNAARRAMASLQPALWGQTSKRTYTLDAGCYQNLVGKAGFTDIFALRNVISNVNTDNTPGSAVRPVTRGQMDSFRPSWQSDTGVEVVNWFPDEANHLAFWIYPQLPDGGKLALAVAVQAADLTQAFETAMPMDVMEAPMLNYVLHRAYAKDAEVAQNAQLSASYLSLFTSAVSA